MGLSEVLRALGQANFEDANIDYNASFYLPGEFTEELVARLRAAHDVKEELGKNFRPVVTIGRKAEKAEVA